MPGALRTGNALTLQPLPFSDNQPGHLGLPPIGADSGGADSYEITENGTLIAHGTGLYHFPVVRLSRKPSVISFTETASRRGGVWLSTGSRTGWTWRSVRRPSVRLPQGWACGLAPDGSVFFRCVVQPLMTLDYLVRGMALNGSAPPGLQVIMLTVGHEQLATAARVTGAAAQISYDGGRTWQRAPVTMAGGGRFLVTFTAPGGVDVTLRVSATDAAGGSIAETIDSAYRVRF